MKRELRPSRRGNSKELEFSVLTFSDLLEEVQDLHLWQGKDYKEERKKQQALLEKMQFERAEKLRALKMAQKK